MSLGVPGVDLPPVPGVDFFAQETWVEDGYPMTGPSFPSPGDIIVVIIHYPGGGRAERTHEGMLDRMRRMQRDYVDNRGYSLGYGVVVPTFGGLYEGRGLRLRNAANAGKKVPGNANYWTVSVQLNVTGQDAGTDKQVRDVAFWIGYLRDLGMQVVIDYHGTIDYTACSGEGIIPQVTAGDFEPERWGYPGIGNEPSPEPEPEPEPAPPYPELPFQDPPPHVPNPGGTMSDQFTFQAQRLLDTRSGGKKVPTSGTVTVALPPGLLPIGAQVTLTVVDPEERGFLTVFPGGDIPNVSALNFAPGQVVANTTATEVNGDGTISVFCSAKTHLIVDLVGLYS